MLKMYIFQNIVKTTLFLFIVSKGFSPTCYLLSTYLPETLIKEDKEEEKSVVF